MAAGQNYTEFPEDARYRGVLIPARIKATWNNVSGRWWKQGVDDALGPEGESEVQQFPEFGRFFK